MAHIFSADLCYWHRILERSYYYQQRIKNHLSIDQANKKKAADHGALYHTVHVAFNDTDFFSV